METARSVARGESFHEGEFPTEASTTRAADAGVIHEDLDVGEAVREVLPEWPAFRRAASVRSPFLRPDYLALWARMIGREDRCRIVTARRDGTLVGFAPFMISKGAFGPAHLRVLRFIGNNAGFPGDVMYSDIAAVRPQAPVLRAILERASRWRLRAWDLGYISPTSETCALAPRILGAPDRHGEAEHLPYVVRPLPDDWDAFLRSLSGEVRRNFRRRCRRLAEIGSVEVRTARTPPDVRRTILGLLRNQEHWLRGTAKQHWLGDAAVERFLLAAGELLAADGAFLAFTLELGGKPIAWNIGVCDGGRYFEQMASYDRAYRACAPGSLLGMLVAQRLIEQGARRMELGPGFDERKRRIGGTPEEFEHLHGYRGWVRAAAIVHHTVRRGRAS